MKTFSFLCGDVNYREYGGKWYRKSGKIYHVIELINMHEENGKRDGDKYVVSLAGIDIESPDLAKAQEFTGLEGDNTELGKVEALHSYGVIYPFGNLTGNNYRQLLQKAKRASLALDDTDSLEAAMNRPVNELGQTASEYAAGDMTGAIERRLQQNKVTVMKRSDILKCKFAILVPSHYRADGSCKCDDVEERKRMISEWEYTESDFVDIPLRR